MSVPHDVNQSQTPHQHGWAEPLPPRRITGVRRFVLQVVVPVIVLVGAVLGYQYLKATKPEVAKRKAREMEFVVRVAPVKIANVTPKLKLYGTTVAGRQLDIRSLVSGRVVETGPGLRDGGEVRKGDVLIKLDPFDFNVGLNEAKAQLAEARAKYVEMKASLASEEFNVTFAGRQLELARKDVDRAAPLQKRGAVSARTVDDRQLIAVQREQAVKQHTSTVAVWKARLAQQTAAIKRLEASVEQAKRRINETTLTAPFDAYVTAVGAQVGRLLNVNDVVASMIDRDRIDVRFSLNNDQFGRLVGGDSKLKGRFVAVSWNVGEKTLKYRAQIDRIGARMSTGTGGVDIYARILEPGLPVPIRPGLFVSLEMDDAQFDGVAALPGSAIYHGDTVYVVKNDRLQSRTVKVVGIYENSVLVRGDVKPGESVVVTRLSTPGDGVRVKELAGHGGGA